jgi:hypothetical protein
VIRLKNTPQTHAFLTLLMAVANAQKKALLDGEPIDPDRCDGCGETHGRRR